ncbi:RecB-family nuclease [Methanopyrus sp. KOL6]|uniref:RecB-family nuclease n=1 Tax=Methanopyrus sp. KOL6 TaxID=1937004 RepID=UPI0012F81927|nr:RecB-family nuclease [Methanopyrus sp. KOL6]
MIPVTVVYHNVHSPRKVEEIARTVAGFGVKRFVISRALGSAAQEGVPKAQKICLEAGIELLFFRDLKEALEVLSPDVTYMAEDAEHGGAKPLDFDAVAEGIREKEVCFVFGSARPGLTKQELELGDEAVYVGTERNVGEVGAVAILLHELRKRLNQ